MQRKQIGIIYDVTSTTEFIFMLNEDFSKEDLVFNYVEIDSENNEKIIARIIDVKKKNPLLSEDTASVIGKEDLTHGLAISPLSERFTYGYAECEVVGLLTEDGNLEHNRRPIEPSSPVYSISEDSIRKIFYNPNPGYIPIGRMESLESTGYLITINGDELTSKHFAVFGMTGSGKTTTSAKIMEELASRGHRIVIFDPHDDYQYINDYSYILNNKRISLNELYNEFKNRGLSINKDEIIPFFMVASIVYNNSSLYDIIPEKDSSGHIVRTDFLDKLSQDDIDDIKSSSLFKILKNMNYVEHIICFPELQHYGEEFEDFTIDLMGAFLNEAFTSAQRRALLKALSDLSKDPHAKFLKGIPFLQRLWSLIDSYNIDNRTKDAIKGKINTLQAIYRDLLRGLGTTEKEKISKVCPLADLKYLAKEICSKLKGSNKIIFRISLSSLPDRIRKTFVYAVIEYIFRVYKYNSSINIKDEEISMNEKNRYSVLFVLEEARTLIPRRPKYDEDYSGYLSVRAVRNLAYEGRKFRLAYGLISQKPSNVDDEIASQCNTLILHQLKNPDDQSYVKQVTEGLTQKEIEMIKNIGKGRAIITGTAINSTVLVKIENRYSREGIQAPKPISERIESDIQNIRKSIKGRNRT